MLTGDYASWVGSWTPSELPPGQALREPKPLFRKLPPETVDEELAARRRAAVIDTHAHLDALDDDPAEVVARAREAGVGRILTVGTTPAGCRRALELADAHDGVFAILGIHPHEAGGTTDADVAELRELLDHPKAVAVGETGLDWFRDYAPRDAQRGLFDAQLALAAELDKPVVIHTRAADDDTLAALAGFDGTRRPPLLLVAAPARAGARARLVRLVRRQRHLPEGGRAAPRRDADARRPDPRRDRLPVPRAAADARPPERAGLRHAHARRARAGARGGAGRSSSARSTRNATACFGLPA